MQGFIKDDAMLTPPMLIGQISRLHSCRMREVERLEPVMTQNSCRMLLVRLSFGDGVTQLELSHSTRLKPPTVSVALKRLEHEGYIRREADEDDLRAVHVYLTDKGRELERANIERYDRTDGLMMYGFTPEETQTLKSLLIRVRNNLSEGKENGTR